MTADPPARAPARRHHRARAPLAAALLVALAGCALAPPKLTPPVLATDAPLAGAPVPAHGAWPAADWWTRYQDPTLDALVQRALAHAPTLAQAEARVALAQAAVAAQGAAGNPYLAGSAGVQRQRISEHGLFPVQFLGFTWYNQADLGAQFKYSFDWWGKHRAEVESAVDQAHAAAAEAASARLALTTAVAQTYYGWQADQARLALAEQAIDARQHLRDLAQARLTRGIAGADSVREADAALVGVQRARTALLASAASRQIALAALLGVAPADLPALTPRPLPAVAAGLPANASLNLVARRADVTASRWRVEAAVQDVAAARAAFYPDLGLSGMLGLSSIDLGKLFTAGSRVAALAPALSLPLFDGGRLKAGYRVSRAQLDSAVADYHAAVVQAASDAAQRALQVQQLADEATQQAEAVAAARGLRDSARLRARQGLADDRDIARATLNLLQAEDAARVLAAARVTADIALIQSLGGGYASAPSAAAPSPSTSSTAAPASSPAAAAPAAPTSPAKGLPTP
jgi:multidrug efflux system outer membrane protein